MPALAMAGSGGASAGSGGTSAGTAPGSSSYPTPSVEPGNTTVSASGDGITLQTSASAFVPSGVAVSGTVPAGDGGAAVEIDELLTGPNPSWTAVTVLHALSGGSFAGTVHTNRTGPLTLRAVLQGSQASSASSSPPAVSITVYRRSIATLYGPGFYGHRTACGTILRRHTIGVANRTLPCGTPVQIYYKGSVITVPVIDRGPYAHNANWDLTMATARVLGIPGTVRLGAAPVSSASSGSGTTTGSATPAAQ